MTPPSIGSTGRRDTPAVPRRPGALPPAGPVWFASVMGTGVSATLVQTYWPWLHLAPVFLVAAWLLLVGLSLGFATRCLRTPGTLAASVRPIDDAPLWGTVSMALLTVGSATAAVLPAERPGLSGVAWRIDLVLWLLGTVLGVASMVVFALRLPRRGTARHTMVWGLAVVPPMVAATAGALLAAHVPHRFRAALLVAVVLCFVSAAALGWTVLAHAYHNALHDVPVPLAASCSTWVPVALVGQSVAAAQTTALAVGALAPGQAHLARQLADGWSLLMLALGVPVIEWATLVVARGVRGRMPFTPGWWSITFPMGSMALGSHWLAVAGHPVLDVAGQLWTAALLLAVIVCAVGTATAWHRGRAAP